MYYLTPCSNAAMLSLPFKKGAVTILAYRLVAAQTALNKRFFCEQKSSVSRYDRLSGTVARLARATLVRQFHSVCLQMIGVIWGWVYNLIRVAIMKTNSTRHQSSQNPQLKSVSLFDCFLHRPQIASCITGTKAFNIKSRNPATIIKFVAMAGGVA